ncbi:MAG TPA: glycerol-3-phosphate dehydrogenase/oxidase [Nocardioides sp.]|jgi:glycerol-3-phosphate dehydrogenase|uniref:glycerol-3-phosphate dehydrogenase/oxidase n=1 Tax=Nocardioides sp. TaxID=35761 RepID=UPI002E333BB7|nr:glycerol-3-phosphate dehydrogenase/oxidase [Nocardioides sp.]HEX3932196.1 glycerol-3-phosphate dehydrogenase/oxidase [Nocardioides sp.]
MTATEGPVDVLIVGGGVVGTGAALDAVSRGLSVGLLEQRDLASGTSSRSSKLVHGGLRYLEMFDFGLVREALEERGLLLTRLAPHLVRPVPFLYPLHRTVERPYVGAGLALYDVLAMAGKYEMGLPKHKHLFRRQVARIAPDLRTDDLSGAVRYYDCQVDDARLVVTLARTAAHHGALVATRTRVTGFLRGESRVVGVRATDLESGQELEIHARAVVNATGVWTDDVEGLLGGTPTLNVEASKGIHLVVPRDRIRSECGFITKTEKSVLFVIPWGRHWIIGTTDTAWDLDLAHPAASRTDIDYLLHHVNTMLKVPLDHDDVEGVYAGLRPLLAGKPGRGVGSGGEGEARSATTKVSREHTVVSPAPGLVLIAGGKLTTYRVMARDAVDVAVRGWAGVAPSQTERVPLLGAEGFLTRTNQRVALSRRSGLEVGRIDHLLGRYGGLLDEVLALVAARPDLGEPLPGAEDYLCAEIVYAVSHEGARHLDDVLARRTRISIETFDRGTVAVTAAADLMAAELGWDAARRDDEVDHYLRRVEAERQSQEKLTDQEADEARVSAPDIV